MWSNASKQRVDGEEGEDENDGNVIRNHSDFLSLEQEIASSTYLDLFQSYSTVSVVPTFYTSLFSDWKHPFFQVAYRH